MEWLPAESMALLVSQKEKQKQRQQLQGEAQNQAQILTGRVPTLLVVKRYWVDRIGYFDAFDRDLLALLAVGGDTKSPSLVSVQVALTASLSNYAIEQTLVEIVSQDTEEDNKVEPRWIKILWQSALSPYSPLERCWSRWLSTTEHQKSI